MPRELSPFELDRELARVVPRARAAYRALRGGREVTLTVPDVLSDPETHDRLSSERSDPIAAPLLRWLYWLELMQRALGLEGARVRCYRAQRHALDSPLSGHFTWRELLGHALRDGARRPALLDVMLQRGDDLRDAGTRLYELRAEFSRFAGRTRAELELPEPDVAEVARQFLAQSADAFDSLGARTLADVLELGLAHGADDGWPRQVSLRSLHELLGSPDILKSLKLEPGELPAPLSASSFARGLLRLGAAWTSALAPGELPFCLAHDPFGLSRAEHGALFAGLVGEPAFLKRQLGLGKDRALQHMRALNRSALLFVRLLALRVVQDAPSLEGPRSLTEAFSEGSALALGFELPPHAAGLLFRPRVGDAQRFAGCLLAAKRAQQLSDEHDDDWFRNPRAVERLRAEARVVAPVTCSKEALAAGAQRLGSRLAERL